MPRQPPAGDQPWPGIRRRWHAGPAARRVRGRGVRPRAQPADPTAIARIAIQALTVLDEGCGSDGGGNFISAHRNDEGWRCADCRTDWPCLVFRRRLRILYANDLGRLRTFMRHFRDRAAPDLSTLTPAQLDTRFLGWIDRPRPRPYPRRSI